MIFVFSWTLTGKDAEALLFQEEDEAEEEQDAEDPLHKLLKSRNRLDLKTDISILDFFQLYTYSQYPKTVP